MLQPNAEVEGTESLDRIRCHGQNSRRSAVRDFIGDMVATGENSPATVRNVGQILAKVMRSSVDAGLIAHSSCDGGRLPAEGRRAMRFLTADQVAALATEVGGDWEALVHTAAMPSCHSRRRSASPCGNRTSPAASEHLPHRRSTSTGSRFHDLRHTAVALAISQGAHPKALQERLGHSSVTVTLDR